jgi:hypothetical protein
MTETSINVGHQNNHNNNPQGLSGLGWIRFNIDYFKTRDGLLKLVQLVRKF